MQPQNHLLWVNMKEADKPAGCGPEFVSGLSGAVDKAPKILKTLLFLFRKTGHTVHKTLVKSLDPFPKR